MRQHPRRLATLGLLALLSLSVPAHAQLAPPQTPGARATVPVAPPQPGVGPAQAQSATAAAGDALSTPLPFDSAVRTGTLPNGLRFFIRRNARPEHRVALRLAVKAGSLFEDDDQQGLAHLIEHMAFNGSAHFKPGELVAYFESMGARLGPHVNAYTSFEETVYMLDLPADRPEVVAKGLDAMADFAGGLSLTPDQIDKERGVVIEEWRGRLGASTRVRDKQVPVLYRDSRYAERLPIGKPEVIRNAPASRLRDFYDTWYRPDRMAIVVVGDIDPAEVEAAVRDAFGPLQARAPQSAPPSSRVPIQAERLVTVTSDPEVTQSTVQVLRKRPREDNRTVGDYRRALIDTLFVRMLNDRFTELSRRPDAKFLSAGGGSNSLSKDVDAFSMSARVQDGGIADGLTALEVEARRAREFGFTQAELDRARRAVMAAYARAYNERDKNESSSYAQEYLSYFLDDEPSPGIEYEHRLAQQFLPTITLDDVTSHARSRLGEQGQVVLAVAPQKESVSVPSEADVRSVMAAADRLDLTAWVDTVADRPLIEHAPEPGQVVSRRELPDLGVTVVRFANGLEAWLKPTDFKNDQVLFTMYSMGGAALAGREDYLQASFAPQLVRLSGVGGIKALDLDKMLAGRLVSVSPFVGLTTHGISGSSTPADLETAMQLLYLNFTSPSPDPEAFALMRRQLEAAVANRGRSPGQAFGEKIEEINSSGHYSSEPLTAQNVATLDPAKMLAQYRKLFANAADFTLFVVGAFDERTLLPILSNYVGALPSTGSPTAAFTDPGVHFPSGIQRSEVQKGREPKSQTLISFFADPGFDPMEQERVIAATTILETVLRDALREELGQTYTVSVGLSQSPPQRGDGFVGVSFGAAPENIGTMTDLVLKEVRRLQQQGPSTEAVSNAKEGARREYETALKENAYWMRRLQTVHMLGGNPGDILTRARRIDSLTAAAVQDAFQKYFPLDRYTVVTLVPETSAQQ
ncbi:MAG: M16 family metallopeptidase [Vicinamibacterales bacterium]